MTVRVGEAFIYGRTRDNARAILAAANRVGVDQRAVRTTDSGFIVPVKVADEFERGGDPTWVATDAVF